MSDDIFIKKYKLKTFLDEIYNRTLFQSVLR